MEREIGELKRVDVVHITTPNHLHYTQAKEALAAVAVSNRERRWVEIAP